MRTHMILMKAERVHFYGDGMIGVEIVGQEIAEEDRKTLQRLYPDLGEKAWELLDKQSALDAMSGVVVADNPKLHRTVETSDGYERMTSVPAQPAKKSVKGE